MLEGVTLPFGRPEPLSMNKALAGLSLLLGIACVSPAVRAGGIDLALSNETANLALLLNPHRFRTGNGAELTLGGFISEDDDRLVHASLMAKGKQRTRTSMYSLAAGVKAIGGDVAIESERVLPGAEDDERVGALALGFEFGIINASPRNPVEFKLGAFFAPSISSFSDAEEFSEFTARLQIEVIPTASAYVGYRRMGFDTNDYDDVRLDRSVHIGLEIVY